MRQEDNIYIAGHTGLIGSAMVRCLRRHGFKNLILKNRSELDLTDNKLVDHFFEENRPRYVVLAAGRVGGIIENQNYPTDFININLAIQLNVIKAAHKIGVQKLIFFGSSCMYPRDCPQPMAETALLSGVPEISSLPYAISKFAGVQMCLAYNQQYGIHRFIPVIPNSAYGPNDNFDPQAGHVLASLLHRFHEAVQNKTKNLTLWGSGNPRREFIHADDIANACMSLLSEETGLLKLPVNIGTGVDYSIRDLAKAIANTVGFPGKIEWDTSKPDGAPQKLLDSKRIQSLGWRPTISLEEGLKETYRWYLEHLENIRNCL